MVSPTNLNQAPAHLLHLDINSAFASLEQQANPLLRGVPTVVAAYNKPFGCILAASYEAKLWKVKTGMTVEEGRALCPFLAVRQADPAKYRYIHRAIHTLLLSYSDLVIPKSIDEFLVDLSPSHTPAIQTPVSLAGSIQQAIRSQIGDWIRVSAGLGPNRFLAKLASDLKSDTPFTLNHTNLLKVYTNLSLPDLPGINLRLTKRLQEQGIFTPLAFLDAEPHLLKAAFRSVLSRDWYLRLRGWEVDNFLTRRRTFGQSYVLPHPMNKTQWFPILGKLIDKAAVRMRQAGYAACGAHLYLRFQDRTSFSRGHTQAHPFFHNSDLTSLFDYLLPPHPALVKHLAITLFNLAPLKILQCSLFQDTPRLYHLTQAVDSINHRFGAYTLHLANMLGTESYVHDAIAFGK